MFWYDSFDWFPHTELAFRIIQLFVLVGMLGLACGALMFREIARSGRKIKVRYVVPWCVLFVLWVAVVYVVPRIPYFIN